VFTSGLVYEVMGSTVTDKMIVPYSIALSGERTGLAGIFTADDQKCAEWITTQGKKDIPVVCDGNSGLLLRGYEFSDTIQITHFSGVFNDTPHYLFFCSWNVKYGKIVTTAWSAGMRGMEPLPMINMTKYVKVFESGEAVILERINDD
jgi:hypothetical protein